MGIGPRCESCRLTVTGQTDPVQPDVEHTALAICGSTDQKARSRETGSMHQADEQRLLPFDKHYDLGAPSRRRLQDARTSGNACPAYKSSNVPVEPSRHPRALCLESEKLDQRRWIPATPGDNSYGDRRRGLVLSVNHQRSLLAPSRRRVLRASKYRQSFVRTHETYTLVLYVHFPSRPQTGRSLADILQG